jgi:hypothetical protein
MRAWRASLEEEGGSASSTETTDYKYLSVQVYRNRPTNIRQPPELTNTQSYALWIRVSVTQRSLCHSL